MSQQVTKQTDAPASRELQALRTLSREAFLRMGIPTRNHEEWKYTPVHQSGAAHADFDSPSLAGKWAQAVPDSLKISGADSLHIVFVNGLFQAALSDALPQDHSLTIKNLATCFGDETAMAYLAQVASYEQEPFVAMNTAHFKDGAFIHIAAGTQVSKPIHLIHLNTLSQPAQACAVRNLIVAEKNSNCLVMESYHSLDGTSSGFVNSVTEVVVGSQAYLELVKVQLESDQTTHISFTQAAQERDSTFDAVTITLGGKLVRNNLHTRFNGSNAMAHLYGLYLTDGSQLTDNHTLVDHAVPHCESNELYKGILGGKSSGVFNGKVIVRKDAQKTNAYQSNKNILLSNDASMNSKPQLEIFADDVKCTHGATTGQLDDEALFYLRSRGIGEASARNLLNIAFASDVLEHIRSTEIQEHLGRLVVEKLQRQPE